jgi:AraC-like DNA-binding protein
MANHNSVHFQKVVGMNSKEIMGECYLDIEPAGFCVFDMNTPTNTLHFHEFYELCIVTEGTGEFVHRECLYPLYEGDVFIADPGVFHEIRLIKDRDAHYSGTLTIVFFRITLRTSSSFEVPSKTFEESRLREFLGNHAIVSRSQKQLFSYLKFLESYIESTTTGNYGLRQAVKNMALESMFSLCKPLESPASSKSPVKIQSSANINTPGLGEFETQKDSRVICMPSHSILDLSVNYISVNLHRKIYLHEIASVACTSKRNLQYVFKKELGKTVTDYINIKKTAVAASYLKMNFTISDVCNQIAINDVAQFSRLFKKYQGISPKKFQMTYLS